MLVGCGGGGTLELDLSAALFPDAKSMILAFDEVPSSGEHYRSLLAIDLESPEGAPELPRIDELPENRGAEAIALFLSDDLESIGLEAGNVPILDDERFRLGYLVDQSFAGAQGRRVEPGETEVQEIEYNAGELPERFLTTRIDPTCAKFTATNGQVNVCRNLAFSTRLSPNQFLFATRCQRFFRATVADGRASVESIDSPLGGRAPDADQAVCSAEGRKPDTPGFVPKSPAIHSGHSDGRGSIAYGGLGEIYVDELGRARVTIPVPQVQSQVGEDRGIYWLTGEPKFSTASFELFAMTSKGLVLRVTSTGTVASVEAIHDFAFGVAEDDGFGGLATSGPRRLVAVAPRSSQILLYDHPNARIIEGPPGMGFATAAFVPTVGVLISAEAGRVFRVREDGTEPALEAYPSPKDWSSRIEGLAPFRDGFLIGGTNGFVGEYREGRGFCVTQQLASATPRGLYAMGPEGLEDAVFVVSGKTQSQDRTTYSLITTR